MPNIGPIRHWDYLAVGTIVPAPGGGALQTSCALCGRDAWIEPRGAVYTAPHDAAVVCDACAAREAPDAMALVRQLRSRREFTATVAGATLETDAWASLCPICHREQDPDERVDEGCWHVVDAEYGRAVCSDCLPKIEPPLIKLVEALERLEQTNRMFKSIDPNVKH